MVRAVVLLAVLGAPPATAAQMPEFPAATPARQPAAAVAADTAASPPATVTAARAAPPDALSRWPAAAFRPDRITHASFALGVGVGVGMLGRAPAAGAGVAIGLGLAKELVDERLDRGDLAADVIGAGLAAIVVAALTR